MLLDSEKIGERRPIQQDPYATQDEARSYKGL